MSATNGLWIVTLDNMTSFNSRHGYSSGTHKTYEQLDGLIGSEIDVGSQGPSDSSRSNLESAADTLLPLFGKLVLGLLLSSFIVIAVAGNLLVIIAVLTDRALRQTGNYFIVSLALADTLVAVAVMTFAVANDVMGRWVFGARVCRLWMSADVMCSTASILNLCAISADRYLHIRSPLHYDRLVTHRRCLGAIGLVWIMSALISFLPIHLGWHRVTHSDDVIRHFNLTASDNHQVSSLPQMNFTSTPQRRILPLADEDIDDETVCVLQLNPLYAVLSSTISFYLPCLAMLCIYYRLHRYARRQVESIKLTFKYSPQLAAPSSGHRVKLVCESATRDGAKSLTVDDRLNSCETVAASRATAAAVVNPSQARYKMSDHKAAITLGIIMGVFLLSWGPFFTVNLVVALFGPDSVPSLVFAVFTWLGYCNSTMNPVIYSIFNRQFRDAFSRVLVQGRHHVMCCSTSFRGDVGSDERGCCCCYCCCSFCPGSPSHTRGPKYGAVQSTTGTFVAPRSPNILRPQTSSCSAVVNESPVIGVRITGPSLGTLGSRFTTLEEQKTTSL